MTKTKRQHKKFQKYTNLTLFAISVIVAYILSGWLPFQNFLLGLGSLEYIGAFFAGLLFISTFTVTIGAFLLVILSQNLPAWQIGIIAGFGSLLGDFLIFRFVKNNLTEEIQDIYDSLGGKHLTKVVHTKFFSWTLPVVGAIIIASPFPDEIGISLLGISKMSTARFLVITFILNFVGILLFVLGVSLFKH